MLVSMADDDYELLQPALILASAIPDGPITLHFFHAVSDPHQHSWISDQNLGVCRIVTTSATLSQAEQTSANKSIVDMRLGTHYVVDDHDGLDGNAGVGLTEMYR